MKPIKFNEFIVLTKARSDGYQKCVYCGKHIGKDNVGLSLIKKCEKHYNVWVHINCIEDFCKDIVKFKNENIKKTLAESLC